MATIGDMLGETVVEVTGCQKGSDEILFRCESGKTFKMHHYGDCCERVQVEDVCGDPQDLIGAPLTLAREDSNEGTDHLTPHGGGDSWTWTFYSLATHKGYVTLRWLGESNGYYSESVDFDVLP